MSRENEFINKHILRYGLIYGVLFSLILIIVAVTFKSMELIFLILLLSVIIPIIFYFGRALYWECYDITFQEAWIKLDMGLKNLVGDDGYARIKHKIGGINKEKSFFVSNPNLRIKFILGGNSVYGNSKWKVLVIFHPFSKKNANFIDKLYNNIKNEMGAIERKKGLFRKPISQ